MPTFELIKKYARCWSEARLRERAALWPEPLTWGWFCGERCEPYSRAECLEILSVAVAHAQASRAKLPVPLRLIWQARDRAEKPILLSAMKALGEILDEWDAGEREEPATEEQAQALQTLIE